MFCICGRAAEGRFSLHSIAQKVCAAVLSATLTQRHESLLLICFPALTERTQLVYAQLDLEARLALRKTASPSHFTAALDALEQAHGQPGHKPLSTADDLLPGTFYLQEVDDRFRRKYCRKP